jgi:hypothetical protein
MDALTSLYETLRPWHWWAGSALLLILELVTGTTYLLWPAAALAVVGVIHISPLPIGLTGELMVFAVLTVLFSVFGDRFVRQRWFRSDRPDLNRRALQLVGQTVVAAEGFIAGAGRVKYGDSVWPARLDAPSATPAGARLRIVAVDGVTLVVEPVPEPT